MANFYQFFANINLRKFCFVLSILYSSYTVDIIGGWVICCVIGGDHSSGQAICTLAASDSSSIDSVLQNGTSCLGACQKEPNCYAYAHNAVDCKFRKTSVPNCLTFLESTAANTAILDVNACSSNPCQHNGACIDAIGDYTCLCLPGFGGHSCEFANLALLKPAFESSISGIVTYIASLAVDGIYANSSPTLSCSMTADVSGGPNWLVVDLVLPSVVVQAVLTNRADCCGDRLDNVIVGMTNSFNAGTNPPVRGAYPLCGQYPGKAANGARLVVNCFSNITPYRYVIVQQPIGGPGFLTVCEVEVYG